MDKDYLRLLRPAFLRKDFGKIIGRGGGEEVELPLAHIPPFRRRKYFFVKGKGIVGIGDYPLFPFTDNLVILRNGSIVCKH